MGVGALVLLGTQRIKEAVAYFLAFMSHGTLDYLTTKEGGGVELLWFASSARLKLGLIGLSEIPSRLTLTELVIAIFSELMIFAPLLICILLIRRQGASARKRSQGKVI